MKTPTKTFAIAAAALGLACTANPAFAADTQPMSVDVSVDGLDLSTTAGQKLLERRIEQAARTVCRANHPNTGTRIISQQARACLAKARTQAREQMTALIEDRRRGG